MIEKNYLNELNIIDKIGSGASGIIYLCDFMNKQMAFKKLTASVKVKEFILPKLEHIVKFYGNSSFILPYKFIYNNPEENIFCGYVMNYLKDYNKLCDLELTYKDKINILLKARDLLNVLHNDYKLIHTDINPWNFLYNKDLDSVVLIDFDTCINLNNKKECNGVGLNTLASIYCKYNKCDIGLDIFLFNLLTFSILNNVEFYDVINNIMLNNYGCIEDNSAIEILRDYDDIEFNTLKKEYIIDHL